MELTKMKNLGKEMTNKLHHIGIKTEDELRALGSKEAFARLKKVYPNVCLVHLYTLQGAIDDIDYNMLPEDIKADLKKYSDRLK